MVDFVPLNSDLAKAKFVVVVSSFFEVAEPFHSIKLKHNINLKFIKINYALQLSNILNNNEIGLPFKFIVNSLTVLLNSTLVFFNSSEPFNFMKLTDKYELYLKLFKNKLCLSVLFLNCSDPTLRPCNLKFLNHSI
jgi:hypothetical protein